MCNFVELLENPENFQVLQDVDHLNVFVPTGTYSGDHLEKPIVVAVCGPKVDPIVLLRHLDEITNHLVVIEPDFELHGHEVKGQLSQHLKKLIDAHLPEHEVLEPEFNSVSEIDVKSQLSLHLAEFIAAQSPFLPDEPVVKEFVVKEHEFEDIRRSIVLFDNNARYSRKPQYFVSRNLKLPVMGNLSSKHLFSRKILRRGDWFSMRPIF